MQYVPEKQGQKKRSRASTSKRANAGVSGSQASGQKSDVPVGQTERYESHHSSLCFDKSKYHSPAAFAAALAGKRNASQPRIGAARSRFMTSNDKGQLMVGMASDSSSAAAHVHQNPGHTGLPAEGVFRTQFEVPRQAMETEPAIIPDLSLSDDSEREPQNAAASVLERNQRTRRPSARARESLQYALDMGQSTEITPDKSRGKKAHCARSDRKQADQDQGQDQGQGEGERFRGDDGESTRFRPWTTQENRAEAPAAAAELIGFCIRKGNDLIHLNNPKLVSLSLLCCTTLVGIFFDVILTPATAIMARSPEHSSRSRNIRHKTPTSC